MKECYVLITLKSPANKKWRRVLATKKAQKHSGH